MNSSKQNFDSVRNKSISNLAKEGEKQRRNKGNHHNSNSYIPNINKNSKRMVSPKRDNKVSVNTALYMDAEIRRDNKEAERKRSQSQEKEKKVRKPTLNTSK